MKEKEYFKYLDASQSDRLRLRIRIEKGKVVDVVVQYESLIKESWKQIVRYDCAHGFFHRDIISPDGNKEKQAIAIQDMATALTYAEQDLKDRWEFYKAKYLKKLKQ